MIPPRACLQCRQAKVRCDRTRPACGRCRLRGIPCSGFETEADYIFRNENAIAQQNSQRARRSPTSGRNVLVPFEIMEPLEQSRPSQVSTSASALKLLHPWLKTHYLARVPAALERDVEARAIDRFFVNWTLYPCNDGSRPGHLAGLPLLYLSAASESIVWFAVRALAFADLRHFSIDNVPAATKALRNYGCALGQLRTDMNDKQKVSSDHVLAALLLIDDFESIYLARTEPLGPHSNAILHVLKVRGDDQFYDRSQFSLWRVAHHRLQSHQIFLHKDPTEEQKQWLSKLDTDLTSFHFSADVHQMSSLAAAADKIISEKSTADSVLPHTVAQVQGLIQTITEFLVSVEKWTMMLTGTWKPGLDDPDQLSLSTELDESFQHPVPNFTCPKLLNHHDIWSAEKIVFHSASQIMLRESLIDIINHAATLYGHRLDPEGAERIRAERLMIDRLSSTIIRTFPQLLGLLRKGSQERISPAQGKMIGRFYSLFPLQVVEKARFTSDQHKKTASEVIAWIKSSHELE